MKFIVYVNHPTNKAIIHNVDCHKYKNRKRDKTINGYWSDMFMDFESAKKFAVSRGKKNVDTCAFCMTESIDW